MKGERYSRPADIIRCQSRISLTKVRITDSFGIRKHPHFIEYSITQLFQCCQFSY